jgi:sulfoxide reductase heme-binding subunit YedZ
MNKLLLHRATKPLLILACLLPAAWLFYAAAGDLLGANPQEALERRTGDWALRLLCLTLAVTPLRQWTGWHALLRFRRMLGLATFGYACLHLLAYSWFDMGFDLAAIVGDIPKRPFILVGFTAWLLLLPLAATSFNRAIKALGGKRWQALHRAVYAIAGFALLHFFWMRAGKNDFAEWSIYAVVLGGLLGWRAWRAWGPKAAAPAAARRPATQRVAQ